MHGCDRPKRIRNMISQSPASKSLNRESATSSVGERIALILCALSLVAYLGFSLSVRALVSELIRLTGKFLG